MITEKRYPRQISKKELDKYLEHAWYRMGQSIFTCHFLCFGEKIFSAIWLRLLLDDFQFKKSQRKLLKKNASYRTVIRKMKINKEKEELYQKYRWYRFKGNLSINLRDSLFDGQFISIYYTLECCIYDGEKLIAASFFDLGKNSMASILGMYDPDYKEDSLGYYTMLLEMQYGIEHGIKYYYPGYIVPGYPMFDYKKRIGATDYFDISKQSWIPLEKLDPSDYPLDKIISKLSTLQVALKKANVSSRIYYYALFETHIYTYWDANYLKYPVFLWCDILDDHSECLIISYDLTCSKYVLLQCKLAGELPLFLEQLFEEDHTDDYPSFLEILTVKQKVFIGHEIAEFADMLSNFKNLRQLKE